LASASRNHPNIVNKNAKHQKYTLSLFSFSFFFNSNTQYKKTTETFFTRFNITFSSSSFCPLSSRQYQERREGENAYLLINKLEKNDIDFLRPLVIFLFSFFDEVVFLFLLFFYSKKAEDRRKKKRRIFSLVRHCSF
jgi:hypothetical protein